MSDPVPRRPLHRFRIFSRLPEFLPCCPWVSSAPRNCRLRASFRTAPRPRRHRFGRNENASTPCHPRRASCPAYLRPPRAAAGGRAGRNPPARPYLRCAATAGARYCPAAVCRPKAVRPPPRRRAPAGSRAASRPVRSPAGGCRCRIPTSRCCTPRRSRANLPLRSSGRRPRRSSRPRNRRPGCAG